jgi:putative ABC transport system permease protein
MVEGMVRDLRLAVRSLRATPVAAAVTVLSLALAIGANSAIFSITNSLLLRPLPVHEPERLVLLTDASAAPRGRAWSYPVWAQVQQKPAMFAGSAAWSFTRFNLASGGEAQFVEGLWASGSFFRTLGVSTSVGRPFADADDQRGGGPDGPVAVISHAFWQRHFGGAPDIVGRRLVLNAVPFAIVGVAPRGFFGPEVGRAFDVAVPVQTEQLVRGRDSALDSASTNFLTMAARLNRRQTVAAAAAEFQAARTEIREATLGPWDKAVADRYLSTPFTLVPAATGQSNLRRNYERPVQILAAVVALVLLIGCVNVVNLLLARASAIRHELSVRRALGASSARLVRQSFAESVVLAGAGAWFGVLLAGYVAPFLVRQLSTPTNVVFLDVSLDGPVLLFTVVVTVFVAILVGIAPAIRAARVPPTDALVSRGLAVQAHAGVSAWLVAGQVALSVVLVVAAGLFIRSFVSLTSQDLGLRPAGVLVATIDPQRADLEIAERVPTYERARNAVLALPDVADAAVSHVTPVGGGGFTPSIEVSGSRDSRDGAGSQLVPPDRDVFGNLISPRWFATFGTRLVAGRDFTDGDRAGAPRVAIVNESFVRRYLSDGQALGRTITIYARTSRALPAEIVGVAEDAIYTSPHEPPPPTWYLPMAQFEVPGFPFAFARLSVRARTGEPRLLTRSVTAAVQNVNPNLSLTFRPLADQIRTSLTRERLLAQLAGFFGVLAVLLAGLGMYGVAAHAISRRRREIAIRVAVGAAPSRVIRLIVGRLLVLVAVGLVAGAGISLWASRFVGGLIFGLEARDPLAVAGAIIALSVVGTLAGWLPARRAARLDPVVVLRES